MTPKHSPTTLPNTPQPVTLHLSAFRIIEDSFSGFQLHGFGEQRKTGFRRSAISSGRAGQVYCKIANAWRLLAHPGWTAQRTLRRPCVRCSYGNDPNDLPLSAMQRGFVRIQAYFLGYAAKRQGRGCLTRLGSEYVVGVEWFSDALCASEGFGNLLSLPKLCGDVYGARGLVYLGGHLPLRF